jgi:hypothetical protein
MERKVVEEQIHVAASSLLETVKKLVHEGNVRRIVIRNAEGRTLLDMPVTAGVAGVVLLPFFTMVAGLVALFKEFTIVVERHESPPGDATP